MQRNKRTSNRARDEKESTTCALKYLIFSRHSSLLNLLPDERHLVEEDEEIATVLN